MSDTLPAGLPLLGRGRHRDPERGSCLMEYVSVLAGERFSDRPRCTPRAFTWLAQRVNDAVSDAARPELALRAPLLAGGTDGRDPTAQVLAVVARAGLDLGPDPWCRRARRIAAGRPVGWRHPGARLCLLEAFLAVVRGVAGLPGAERDRRLIGLLDAVLDATYPAGTRAAVTVR